MKYREEIITAKVAKEHVEDTLKSEIMFLKDQVVAEQQEKNTVEETLTNEITHLQEDLGETCYLVVEFLICQVQPVLPGRSKTQQIDT